MEIESVAHASPLPPLRWLITGGCGFIGRNLVKSLVDEGRHHIRIVDNLSASARDDLAQVCNFGERDPANLISASLEILPGGQHRSTSASVELIVADILDAELALNSAHSMDVIVHLAANTGVAPSVEDPRSDCENNVIGTLNYLEAARHNHVKKFIFASSGAPVGEVEPPIHENVVPHPVSPYGASKLAGEGYCSAYYRAFGVQTVTLRFGNVYGPLSSLKNSVVAKFIKHAIEGLPLEIYGDGNQTRDFIYSEDLIRAIRLSAVKEEAAGEIFQIASNRETTINQLTEKLIPELHDCGIENINVQNANPRRGDVKRNFSDTSKAAALLNWRSEISLQIGLRKTVRWYLESR